MSQGLEGLLTGHTLVKRYRIEEVVGRGGFAVVYHATDTRLGRPVAVKVITLTAEDPGQRELLRERLHREARAAASLPHHPNLVTVHDVGTDPQLGLDFLVMELLRGENLSQALQRGRPPLARALRILRDAADGLAVGHRAGLVHRDVKPGNIFLAAPHDGGDPEAFRVCLLDYGIAQAIEDDQTVTRGMGANALSPAFASPEQLRGDRDLPPATDVFSLGVVGYQLLTGERPFTTEPGQMPTGWTVRRPLREISPEVPPAVEAVVMRAMSVDPRDRFVDADAFVEALDAAVGADDITQARSIAAKAHGPGLGALVVDDDEEFEDDRTMLAPPRKVVAATAAAAAPRAVPPLRPPAHAAPRKGSKLPVVLVLALLLAAAAGAWALMRGGAGATDPNLVAGEDTLPSTAGADDEGPADEGQTVVIPPRTAEDVNAPAGAPPAGGSGAAPSASSPAAGTPAVVVPAPRTPSSGARPPVAAPPSDPGLPARQVPIARPPQQPATPPAAEPGAPPAQTPPPPQPQPEPEPARPDPPLLGRPVQPEQPPVITPNPNAPRDTIRIGNPR